MHQDDREPLGETQELLEVSAGDGVALEGISNQVTDYSEEAPRSRQRPGYTRPASTKSGAVHFT